MNERSTDSALRVGLLLSTKYFEDFYGRGLGLDRRSYLERYRNDWSWEWCQMLATMGVETVLYLATIEAPGRHVTAEGFEVRFLPLMQIAKPWLRFSFLERTPPGRYLAQVANAGALLRPLRSALKVDRIDVLCVQEYWTGRFDLLVRAVPYPIVTVDQGQPDRRELKLFKRSSFARSAEVVVQTNREAEKVTRYGARPRQIPNAVDTSFFSPNPSSNPESARTLLCVGRLHDAQKRFSDVIQALDLLPRSWRLLFAGIGPDQGRYEELATQLGVADRIKFLGFIAGRCELRNLYRIAGVVVLPSAYEGLPMVILEAMSCAIPVVGSKIPALAEVIEDGRTGLLVSLGDSAAIAAASEEAYRRREELGAAARAQILANNDQRIVARELAEVMYAAAASGSH